jgi:GH35 family endo-1,4-beta-xylanase
MKPSTVQTTILIHSLYEIVSGSENFGPDLMKYAFIFAHEADPDVQLYYNDYAIEATGLKLNKTIELVSWLSQPEANYLTV